MTVSKARQLYDILKAQILEGKFADQEKLPSIRDLATEYQLSKNTVNTVMAMLVNEGLAQVKEGNGTYVNRGRGPAKARMIGMLLLDFTRGNMYVDTELLGSVQRGITKDYYLSLVNTADRCDVFCEGLERLLDMGVAGFLVIPPRLGPQSAEEMRRVQSLISQRPTVFMNRGIKGIEADMYSMDLRKGVESAFEYLVTSGKKRIAMVLHDSEKFEREEREAYQLLTRLYGMQEREDLLIPWSNDIGEIKRALGGMMGEIDALIAPDNVLAQTADILLKSGKRVPAELSLVGINDTICSRMFNPPLTSIAFPVERIGRCAVAKLIGRIEGTDDTPPKARNFAPDFIIRGT